MSKTKRLLADPSQLSLLSLIPTDPLDLLADYWRDANEQWFGGKLKPVPIVGAEFDKRKSELALMGTYHHYDPRITIRELFLERLDEPALYLLTTDVVLHEMVHQWVAAQRVDEVSHGPRFTAKCNEIGAALGLGPVTQRKPRGRDGQLSRHWPHDVRPDRAYWLDNPRRVHWDRHWGEPLPRHTTLVTRISRFGNPFLVSQHGLYAAIRLYREWLDGDGPDEVSVGNRLITYSRKRVLDDLPLLGGKDLACACPEGQPCHGDTLLELASRTEPKP